MKSTTLASMKFHRLMAKLKTPYRADVIGILESLWQFAAANAITGAIGKFTDREIVAWMSCRTFDLTAEGLMEAIVECGFVDAHPVHRLVIHDWHEHCPNYVRANMTKYGHRFANLPELDERQPKPATRNGRKQELPRELPRERPMGASPGNSHGSSHQTKPNQTKPSPPPTPSSEAPAANSPKPAEGGEGVLTWTNIGARLSELGVVAWQNAIEKCKQAGGRPEFAAALIDHWAKHPGAWGVGLLVSRIERGPTVEPTAGWPPPAPQAVAASQDAKKQAEQRVRSEDTAFLTLVKEGRGRGVKEELILAVAIRKGLEGAARRANWIKPGEPTPDPDELTRIAQTPPSG